MDDSSTRGEPETEPEPETLESLRRRAFSRPSSASDELAAREALRALEHLSRRVPATPPADQAPAAPSVAEASAQADIEPVRPNGWLVPALTGIAGLVVGVAVGSTALLQGAATDDTSRSGPEPSSLSAEQAEASDTEVADDESSTGSGRIGDPVRTTRPPLFTTTMIPAGDWFSDQPDAADRLPFSLDHVSSTDSRLLLEDVEGWDVWAAVGGDGSMCLAASRSGEGMATCAAAGDFASRGVQLATGDGIRPGRFDVTWTSAELTARALQQ